MAYVVGPHFDAWFRANPGAHRTDQQGQRILCPKREKLGYPATALKHRIKSMHVCPFCQEQLDQPVALREKGEFAWPTAA